MGAIHASACAARNDPPLVQVDLNWQEAVLGLGLVGIGITLMIVGAYLYVNRER